MSRSTRESRRQDSEITLPSTTRSKSLKMEVVPNGENPQEFSAESGGGGGHHEANPNSDPEFIIRFIQRVKSLPVLYDQEHENFRSTSVKLQTWQVVSEEFKQDVNWCMKKWISLRDYFVKRKKLLRMGKPARPWFYYGEMSFMNMIYGDDDIEFYPDANHDANSNNSMNYNAKDHALLQISVQDEAEDEEQYHYAYDNALEINWGGGDDEETEKSQTTANASKSSFGHFKSPAATENINGNFSMNGNIQRRRSKSSLNRKSESAATADQSKSEKRFKTDNSIPHFTNPFYEVAETSAVEPLEVDGDGEEVKSIQRHDAYDLFSLSVAAHMRNMPKDKAMRLQIKIMNLVYETEFPENGNDS